MPNHISKQERLFVLVSGVVQGVGFRPFVYGLALELGLTGFVRNSNSSVEIEIQGQRSELESFLNCLKTNAPTLASISEIQTVSITTTQESSFQIQSSVLNSDSLRSGHGQSTINVAADSATCKQCLSELFDHNDRRFRYPFINCTGCGPRFSIIESLPYDRQATTMASFKMCQLCQSEYDSPLNRRYHAQPNACPQCGPQLRFSSGERDYFADQALRKAIEELADGRILAIKGLGGFHLVCDAANKKCLASLRQRKQRKRKPFALMMRDLEMLRSYCESSEKEELSLCSAAAPIVLLNKNEMPELPSELAPGLDRLGVMLPYTPLHHLLLTEFGAPLVFTSANISDEPIVIDNEEARLRLTGIADSFLDHNRRIHARYDDSIVQFIENTPSVVRRSRGLAPLALPLPLSIKVDDKETVLAFGGHLKNTFCILQGKQAYLSQHIGDLENLESEEFFLHTLDQYLQLFRLEPALLAQDQHPDYLSGNLAARYARKQQLPLYRVQHHHAHLVACMLEHGITSSCIGVAFDGLGYGPDGKFWGGEFMLAKLDSFERLAHFEYVAMPGGSKAIQNGWRMALSYIHKLPEEEQVEFSDFIAGLCDKYGKHTIELVSKQIMAGFNAPLSSSCGRLFDAVSSLLGVCDENDYEGEAASLLETRAWRHLANLFPEEKIQNLIASEQAYPYELESSDNCLVLKSVPIIQAIKQDMNSGVSVERLAARFHVSLAQWVYDICALIKSQTGLNSVCLSGGVFQNRLLLTLCKQLLVKGNFEVFIPEQVPANDGGISLGQAMIALAQARQGQHGQNQEQKYQRGIIN